MHQDHHITCLGPRNSIHGLNFVTKPGESFMGFKDCSAKFPPQLISNGHLRRGPTIEELKDVHYSFFISVRGKYLLNLLVR